MPVWLLIVSLPGPRSLSVLSVCSVVRRSLRAAGSSAWDRRPSAALMCLEAEISTIAGEPEHRAEAQGRRQNGDWLRVFELPVTLLHAGHRGACPALAGVVRARLPAPV